MRIKFIQEVTMHIFLDTNLLFTDPFLRGNYNRQVINLIEQILTPDEHAEAAKKYLELKFPDEQIKLYMSRVVFEETKNHYTNHIKEHFQNLKEINQNLSRYLSVSSCITVEKQKDDFLSYFDTYYQNLIEKEILKILEHPPSVVNELVNRSVKKIPPFFNDKNEFRDAIIWLTYAQFVEENDLKNCYFLTKNTSDFCQKSDAKKVPVPLHPNLLEDTERFKMYKTVQGLFTADEKFKEFIEETNKIQQESEMIEKMKTLIEEINEDYIESELNSTPELKDIIDLTVSKFITNSLDIDSVYNDVHYGGYLQPLETYPNINSVKIFHIDIYNKEILVSVDVEVDYNIQIMLYNPIDDNIEESAGEVECKFEVPISFIVNDDLKIKDIEADTPFLIKK
ncbi:hypothetical protein BK732_30615 [Bacillus thuringiensis serovar navarrensis]|uniref:DUF4935 domain-containing protein n=2 Tax=Bacillus TaxID=1386 RepID=A0A243A1P3_BACTU|nr:hypothetical protein BK732_30615 [Bacillus thuringiensis serovar navarrensis]